VVTEGKTPGDTSEILARATVNLAGLRAGKTALVDPRQPYIADLFRGGYLVRVATPDAE
jgi:hypothetical protein